LLHNTDIPLSNKNLLFSGQGTTGNLVGIGIISNNIKFIVYNTSVPCAGSFHSDCPLGVNNIVGVNGTATGATYKDVGVSGYAKSNVPNTNNIGLYGEGQGTATGILNYGIYAQASGGSGSTNYGVFAKASSGTYNNYGIWAEALPSSGITPPTGPNYAGYFNGDVVKTGTDNFSSDSIFKENISTISDGWQVISQLIPRKFNFKTTQYSFMGFPGGLQYGFVSQEVENIVPELVGSAVHPERLDSTGAVISPSVTYKTLNYIGIIPFLVKTVQEQQQLIDTLLAKVNTYDEQFAQILTCINNLPADLGCSGSTKRFNPDENNSSTVRQFTLKSPDAAILYQNEPNPFDNSTSIRYYVPGSVKEAMLVFYDEFGREIRKELLNQKGYAKVDVNAEKLAHGIYTYSLLVDGKIADTKKMLKAK